VRPSATLADQIAEVKREIKYRKRVYPHLIAREKMTREDAEVHTLRMLAVLQTLEGMREEGQER
jgi:hypothetical protein